MAELQHQYSLATDASWTVESRGPLTAGQLKERLTLFHQHVSQQEVSTKGLLHSISLVEKLRDALPSSEY